VVVLFRCIFCSLTSPLYRASRARAIWRRVLTGRNAQPTTAATSVALVARMETSAATLHAVAKLNRAVYLLHYRGIVVDVAKEMLAEI